MYKGSIVSKLTGNNTHLLEQFLMKTSNKDNTQHTVEIGGSSSNGESSSGTTIDIIAPSASLSNQARKTSTNGGRMRWSLNHKDKVNSIARSKAIEDFKNHLRLYSACSTSPLDDSNDDRTFLDRSGFGQLLQDIGYKKVDKIEELFHGLLEEIHQTRTNQDFINPSNGGKKTCDTTRKLDCIYPDDLELLYDHSLPYVYKPKLSESFVTAVDNAFPEHDDGSVNRNSSSSHAAPDDDSTDHNDQAELSRRFSFTAGEIGHIITAHADADADTDESSKKSSISIRTTKRKKEKRCFSTFFQSLIGKNSATSGIKQNSNDKMKNSLSKKKFLNIVFNGSPLSKSMMSTQYPIPGKKFSRFY